MIRRAAACLFFAALLAAGSRPAMIRLLLPPHRPPDAPGPAGGLDRAPLRFKSDPTPQDVQAFFAGVRKNTKPGERLALVMPPPYDGVGYTYWRASYELAGRTLLLPGSVITPREVDAIAVWDTMFGQVGFDLAWTEGKGALLRRRP